MRSLARLLLLIAALAYGAMPMTGMSVMAMPMAHSMGDNVEHEAVSSPEVQAMADVNCPHSRMGAAVADTRGDTDHATKPLKTTWHCSACLTLPALPVIADSGKPVRAAEAQALSARLVSQMTAPLTPPPRA